MFSTCHSSSLPPLLPRHAGRASSSERCLERTNSALGAYLLLFATTNTVSDNKHFHIMSCHIMSYLQTDEARVLTLGLFQDGSGLLPHVGALLHSHEQHVGFVALFCGLTFIFIASHRVGLD